MTNPEIVERVYRDFERGDASAVLAAFRADVEFRLAEDHPYRPSGQPLFGHDEVAQGFFMKANGEWDGWTIAVANVVAMGEHVVVEARYRGVYKPTGRPMDVQVCHVWRIVDGKVASFHQYLDTARLQQVMGVVA